MRKVITFVFCGVISIVFSISLLFLILSLTGESEMAYSRSTNWCCSDEKFKNEYVDFYKSKISDLKEKYSIRFSEEYAVLESADLCVFRAYLYNESFTLSLYFANNYDGDFGSFSIDLYFYGSDGNMNEGYSSEQTARELANEITNSFAFDAKTDKNYFKALYDECIKNTADETPHASYKYHFDDLIGNVGYYVALNKDNFGYYYKMQKNSDLDILSNHYRFEGLLKPLE